MRNGCRALLLIRVLCAGVIAVAAVGTGLAVWQLRDRIDWRFGSETVRNLELVADALLSRAGFLLSAALVWAVAVAADRVGPRSGPG